ncbi:dihydroorotate dehydrogenase 2 [Fimbriimonas ginsengisoli Gsoil 348]|uniref:Dihydroorotate dehydrogenase (quinone) n=1 Tax=Fimbriimonas ginsengisoli Gsoil 348 TaxID=661478 RepID=A0A068NNS7_FIMGI|nr:dihydroorotate dehydrogenase 2 [Fimbriimonas ginsengisoli Gsoil 348]
MRPLAFRMDPERVHEMAMGMLRRGLIRAKPFADSRLEQDLFGVHFPNPLGLAAGFDKNAVALEQWHRLGFGFVECGTITYHAQPGNPRPRMFRVPEAQGLINRLGFNNEGAEALATRLGAARPSIPVGINLGKSKVTPLEDAAKDYQASFRLLHRFGAYFVVNVSSPNTPGLRSLQERSALTEILASLREVDATRPMFVKVAPDLELSALDEVLEVAVEAGLTGLIATNTTISRDMIARDPGETGGLSGAPVRAKSNLVLAHLARNAPKEMTLIGVGGILTAEDLYEKIRLGAHLCQLYTGWIYGGPQMIPSVLEQLVTLMDREGVKRLGEVRGSLL